MNIKNIIRSAVVMAVLGVLAVAPARSEHLAPADPHHGSGRSGARYHRGGQGGGRIWNINEHQYSLYHPRTRQTWHHGFTSTDWRSNGRRVRSEGYGNAGLRDMLRQGWRISNHLHRQIGVGSW